MAATAATPTWRAKSGSPQPDADPPHDLLPHLHHRRAIAKLEDSVLAASAQAKNATIDDLGSAAFMVDLASMGHETQYTRLFRS